MEKNLEKEFITEVCLHSAFGKIYSKIRYYLTLSDNYFYGVFIYGFEKESQEE